jgi:ABC-2 type transport system ATP-binding protein
MSREGVTILVTTHYMDEAEYCNRLALIDQGRIVEMGTASEIKQSAMKGTLLLIECSPLGGGLAAVKRAPGVIDASVFGAALHVVVSAELQAITELPAFLAGHGIRLDRIEPITPSLEDAFVSLTGGRTLRGEASQ